MRKLALLLALALPLIFASAATAQTLLGDQNVEATQDGGQGTSEAFGYTATASGTASRINVYLDSADGVQVGLYDDDARKPGALLDKGSVSSNSPGWVSVPLSGGVSIQSGTRYWIAIAAASGSATVTYRDSGASGSTLDYSGTSSTLANPFSMAHEWNSNPASVYVADASSAPTVLFGDQSVANYADNNPDGVARAFAYTAGASGTTSAAEVYVDSGNTAATLKVGVYSDSSGKPGSLIASGSLSSPQSSAWNDVPISAVRVTAGSQYWIAVLGTGGQLNYRDTSGGTAPSYVNANTGLTDLPATYSPWHEYNVSPASAYVNSTGSSQPPHSTPPSNTSKPTVSGMAQQGQTLTATTRSWSGSTPMSYSYQWQQDGTTSVSGATGSSYTAQSSDVGHTLDVVVTATNSAGSASAASAQTATVTSSGGGSTVPCPLTHDAGWDGANSCWATHTGVQAGTGFTEAQILAGQSTLKHIVGDQTITTDGTVIDHEWIDGCVAVRANNVTIKNSLIRSGGGCFGGQGGTAPSAINTGQYTGHASGTLIQDTTVDAMDAGNGSNPYGFGISLGQGSKCLRCNVFGFVKNLWANGSSSEPTLIQDSYIHDYAHDWTSPGGVLVGCPHENGIYNESATYDTFEHDYSIATGAGFCITAALNVQGSYGSSDHVKVDSTYVEGVFGKDIAWNCNSTYSTITNNALSNQNGYYGTDFIGWWTDNIGNVWSGNYIPETGATFPDPSPDGC